MNKILNKNSMLHWYPMVKNLPIPQPKTEIVLTKDRWWDILDGHPLPPGDIRTLEEAIQEMGYPVFIRTDLASAKHRFLKGSFIEKVEDIPRCLYNLVEANAIRDLFFSSIVIREFLLLNSTFQAFEGLPIAKERRYFIIDGKVACHHPYWTEEAIQFRGQEPKDWRALLGYINHETSGEIEFLTAYAEQIPSVIEGNWSVDFAQDINGKWWLIDMALAEESWHPACKNKLTDNPKGP